MSLKGKLAGWIIRRRIKKGVHLMFKKIFVDNWFTTFIGFAYATMSVYQTGGISLKDAAIAAALVLMRDAIPSLKKPSVE